MNLENTVFAFETAPIKRALKVEQVIPLYFAQTMLSVLGFALGIILLVWMISLILAGFGIIDSAAAKVITGILLLGIALTLPVIAFVWYVRSELRQPELPSSLESAAEGKAAEINIAEFLDFEAAGAINYALSFSGNAGTNEVFQALKGHPFVQKIMRRVGISISDGSPIRKSAENQYPISDIVRKAFENAHLLGGEHIGIPSLFLALSEMHPALKEELFQKNIKQDELRMIVHWERYRDVVRERRKMFWLPENLHRVRGIGLDWALTGIWQLQRFAKNMREMLRKNEFSSHAIGREKEINQIEESLVRSTENNVLIVGRPGVGRHSLASRFAEHVISGKCLAPLQNSRVFFLDLGALVSYASHTGNFMSEMRRVFNEALLARNVILIIDDFESYLGEKHGSPIPDLTGLLLQFLPDPNFRLIAITSNDTYHKIIEPQKGLLSNFSVIMLEEPEEDIRLAILLDALPEMEERTNIIVTFSALRAVLRLGKQYFPNEPFPEKGIDLLDQVIAYVLQQGQATVQEDHVRAVVAMKTNAPVGEASPDEKEKLLNLEMLLHQRIINQEDAVIVVSEALRRVRAEVQTLTRPIGSFLFLGPTGVGKTETAKALADVYYGNEDRMIRFDMSEFQDPLSLSQLIGSPDGKESGRLSREMIEHPFSLVLLDEIEKANPKILDLLLQVLDEGRCTDARGDIVSFINSIIIATSNAGSEYIRERIQAGVHGVALGKEITEHVLQKNIFKPEFLNRFDAIVSYPPLTHNHLCEIAKLLLSRLAKRLDTNHGLTLQITDELAEAVAREGYDPQFGARPMRRVIQDSIEGSIARRILDGSLKRGDMITIPPEEVKR